MRSSIRALKIKLKLDGFRNIEDQNLRQNQFSYYKSLDRMKILNGFYNLIQKEEKSVSDESNHLEQALSSSDIMKNKFMNSDDFLFLSFDNVLEIIKNDNIDVNEDKIFESIMTWVKGDINNRFQDLSKLMKYIKISLIPLPYLINFIENDDILKQPIFKCCILNYLYEGLKLSRSLDYSNNYYCNRQNYTNNQLILISTIQIDNQKLELKWLTTENKMNSTECSFFFAPSDFSWIILQDGRIFFILRNLRKDPRCITSRSNIYKNEDYKWYAKIYDGKINQLYSVSNFDFDSDYDFFYQKLKYLPIVELDGCIYFVSHLGNFKCYNIKKNYWSTLEKIQNATRNDFNISLVVLDGYIYSVTDRNVLQYNSSTNKWLHISKNQYSGHRYYTVCSLNGFLYIIGGVDQYGNDLKSVMKFHPSTNTWSYIADMKIGRSNPGSVGLNGLIYVIGGTIPSDSYEIYDPQMDKWTSKNHESMSPIITKTFTLSPNTNINPEIISDFYSFLSSIDLII